MEEIANQPKLGKEDMLWPGLAFQVFTEEELARRQGDVEDRVHLHRGVWWRQAAPFFCLPCNPCAKIDARISAPHPLRGIAGYTHFAAEGAPSNAYYPAIVREHIATYSAGQLSESRRYKVRRALRQIEVRQVEKLEDMLQGGHEVYVSWHERVQWGRNKSDRREYDAWIKREFQQPKSFILGAYRGDKMVAFMLPSAVDNTVMLNFAASHTDYMDTYANDLLYHALLTAARQTPRIEMVYFGPASSKASLDHFKLHYGIVKSFPAYVWLNPISRALAGGYLARRYPWLASEPLPQAVAV